MMLAYQPVRSLATLNIVINQGLAGSKRILPVIDLKEKIVDNYKSERIKIDKGNIEFQNINFDYGDENKTVLKDMNLTVAGGKMTSLVGHSGAPL